MSNLKVLLLSQCTNEKVIKNENGLVRADFYNKGSLKKMETKLEKLSAYKMYSGDQHINIVEGLERLRNKYGANVVDFYIISAGYGLINENDEVAPYNVTFNDMKSKELIDWSHYLKIHDKLQEIITDYDLIIIMLGDKYLKSLEFPYVVKKNAKIVFFTNKKSYGKLKCENKYFVNCGKQEKKSPYGYIGLKGYFFNKISEYLCKREKLFDEIYNNPYTIKNIINDIE